MHATHLNDMPLQHSPALAPPILQAILNLPCTPAWDLWSLGCTLFEAATGTILFGGMEQEAAAHASGVAAADEARSTAVQAAGTWWSSNLQDECTASRRQMQQRLIDHALDTTHLARMRALLGPLPLTLLAHSPVAAAFDWPQPGRCRTKR